jgi:rfaE bifunctional protein kinase chain/domain/rfaE bifunctional protein nucleotidyltransferase chain/domain
MPAEHKIVSLDRLLARRAEARASGKTVVHCHGCFDIVHPGHIHHLEYARSLGDLLIVTVSVDSHVNKGHNRPLIPDDLRAMSLAALECVDLVFLNSDPTAVELLEQLQPDIYVKGREYERNQDPRFLRERDAVTRHGGRIVFSGGEVIYSSTAIIQSMEDAAPFEDEKLRRLAERHGVSAGSVCDRIGRMRGLNVVVVGDFILDRYHFCEPLGMASEAPVMSVRSIREAQYDGGAAVVARHLQAAGCNVALACAWAEDADSIASRERLAAGGVELLGCARRRATVSKNRFVVEQQKVFRSETGAPEPLDSQAVDALSTTLSDRAGTTDLFVLTDFGYGVMGSSLIDQIMPEIRAAGCFVSADVSGTQSNLMRFTGVDLICPTEREARTAVGEFGVGLGAVMSRLFARMHMREAIITLGRQGALTFARSHDDPSARLASEFLPATARNAIDPLGCGDALLAYASAARASGAGLVESALIGSHAAGVQASRVGNTTVGAESVIESVLGSRPLQPAMRMAV